MKKYDMIDKMTDKVANGAAYLLEESLDRLALPAATLIALQDGDIYNKFVETGYAFGDIVSNVMDHPIETCSAAGLVWSTLKLVPYLNRKGRHYMNKKEGIEVAVE